MAYIAALSVVMKWFPEKQKMGAGLATMGFGFGAFAYTASLIPIAHPFAASGGLHIFILSLSGISFFLLGLCGLFLEDPPEDDPRFTLVGEQIPLTEMLRNPQAYVQWTMLFLNATAGSVVTANAAPLMAELDGLPADATSLLPPMMFLGLGHIGWSMAAERIGYRATFALLFGISSIAFFALGNLHNPTAVSLAVTIVFFCYGGSLGSMPGLHADFFGTKHFGTNYGAMLTAIGAASVFGPLFCATVKDITGSYATALQPIGLLLLTAIIFPIMNNETGTTRKAPDPISETPVRRLHAPYH
jgi:OFA family oxalate/formate antiporter-like MFS transporter